MRTLGRIKRSFKYSLFVEGGEPIYEDENGKIEYIVVDGVSVPIERGKTKPHYTTPIEFKASMSNSGGDSNAVEFGIDTTSYSAILIAPNSLNLPLDETSIVWHEKEPILDEYGYSDKASAEYRVAKVSKGIQYTKYLLEKLV